MIRMLDRVRIQGAHPLTLSDDSAGKAVGDACINPHGFMRADLIADDIHDPDLDNQHLTPARALRELDRIRRVTLDADGRNVEVVTRRNGLQAKVLTTFGVDPNEWNRAHIQ